MPKLPTMEEAKREQFLKPFKPANAEGNPIDVQMAIRSAVALEYIAAQLGLLRQTFYQDEKRHPTVTD